MLSYLFGHTVEILLHLFRLEEPCDGCAAPYGFNHIMPLTIDTQTFSVSKKTWSVEYFFVIQGMTLEMFFGYVYSIWIHYVFILKMSLEFLLLTS